MIGITYLRYSDVFGVNPRFETLINKLRKLKLGSVLSNLTAINTMFLQLEFSNSFNNDFTAIQDKLNDNYLTEEINLEIINSSNKDSPVFTRIHTAYLARLAILYCSEESNVLTDGKTSGGFELGECFLIAGNFLLSAEEEANITTSSRIKTKEHLGFQLAPLIDFTNPLDLQNGMIRSEIIYTEILHSEEFKNCLIEDDNANFDIAAEFESATGISLTNYIDITYSIIAIYMNHKTLMQAQFINYDGFFKFSTITKEVIDSYLQIESRTPEQLKELLNKTDQYLDQFSFTPLKTYSVVEVLENIYLSIDPAFLTEKLNSGIYWKIFDNLSSKRKEDFFRVFGSIFELYVRKILNKITRNGTFNVDKGILLSNPKYTNGDKCFDEIIYCPASKHLIVIECKSSFMHTTAKYGKSLDRFINEINEKFVEKTEERKQKKSVKRTPKGVGQLANHIVNLTHEDKAKRMHLENAEFDKWFQTAEKISPVLIVQEPVIGFHITEDYLNTELKKRLKNSRPGLKLNQLTCINIEILERLKPYFAKGEITLEQCLNARALRDPEYLWLFTSFLNSNFTELKKRIVDEENMEILDRISQRIKNNFFADEVDH